MPLTLKSTGGGSVTLASAVTAADTTLTVPSQNGNIVVSDSSSNVTVDGNLTVVGATTLSGNPTVSGTVVMGSSFMRNRIINGDMRIDQRSAGASSTVTSSSYYSCDRWQEAASVSSKYSVQQNAGSVTPPAGFTNYLGVTSLSAYSVAAGDFFVLAQYIEGYNVADLAWGTANAKAVTLSFKVYSSLTGTFGGCIGNNGQTRSYPFSFTVSSANTWTSVSVTIPGDTTGTWLTNNGRGVTVYFNLGTGSTYSGTNATWASAQYFAPTGAVSVVGTNGATFYITGVQLEVGSVATPFERRQYTTELALCQRYYQTSGMGYGYAVNTTLISMNYPFIVTMRTNATVTIVNGTSGLVRMSGGAESITSIGGTYANAVGFSGVNVGGTGFTAGGSYAALSQNVLGFSAEL